MVMIIWNDSDVKAAITLIDQATDCKQNKIQVQKKWIPELFDKSSTLGFQDRFWANYLLFTSKR